MSKKRTRRESAGRPVEEDVPYTMRLPDGRTVYVEVPAKWCERDVSGEIAFTPEAVRHLDRIRVSAMKVPKAPTPGFIRTLRKALSLTQPQLAERVGVDKMSVYRWERGMWKPNPEARKALEKLRRDAARKGIVLAA